MRRVRDRVSPLLVAALVLVAVPSAVPATAVSDEATREAGRAGGSWTGTWATSPTNVPASDRTSFQDQTIRQVVHASLGGDTLRVRLTNEFGDRPLVVGEARIARHAEGAPSTDIVPGSDRRLTFSGRSSVTIPAGAPMLSDPVPLHLPAGVDLTVSIYLPERTPGSTVHAFSFQENVVATGNVTAARTVTADSTTTRWYFLSEISVTGDRRETAAVVALGDSITDGANTQADTDQRWPDLLAARLRAGRGTRHLGVLNQGICGNRLLHDPNPLAGSGAEEYAAYFGHSALRRFDRDVLAQPGARYLVVLLGVNDLGHPGTVAPMSEVVSVDDLIAAHRQLITRAHDRGMKVFGGTITPFGGDTLGFSSPDHERARQAVNRWVRTSGEFDGVVDFDAALRDPAHPDRVLPGYDSGDHLHPNATGMQALADAVPLAFFR
ncbi:MAG: SGNH/GDSL hydrolase family protein [Actinomycetales bacterium]|nr:SGNH/GDSL hydrolase family protein [Actinomycetales bacterium]